MSRLADRLRRTLALGLLSLALPVSTAMANDVSLPGESAFESLPAPDDLSPGEYVWAPQNGPAEGEVSIVVSLPLQRAYVFRGGALIGVSTISSGRPGYETPTGTFNILQKKVDHRSNLYNDAPMPYMQRLTWDGVALHAGQVVAGPASHGCIRLPRAFARQLYQVTELGAAVTVTDAAPAAPEEALAYAF